VDAGQHDVEQDQVVAALAATPQALRPVDGDLHGEPLGHEPATERGGERGVVVDQEQLHPRPLPLWSSSRFPS
jgi:hypothetical protein